MKAQDETTRKYRKAQVECITTESEFNVSVKFYAPDGSWCQMCGWTE